MSSYQLKNLIKQVLYSSILQSVVSNWTDKAENDAQFLFTV